MAGDFFVGVDLGQSRDFTAIVVVERVDFVPPPATRTRNGTSVVAVKHHHVRLCERPRLGTPYPDVVRRVRAIFDGIGSPADLVVDASGVGRPVVDLFEQARVYPIAVTITGGDTAMQNGAAYRVPKRDLVSTLEVVLQERRLKIAQEMPDQSALVDELLNFRATFARSGHESFAAGGSGHDDFVMALALAVWRSRTTERRPVQAPVSGVSEAWEDRDDPDALWLGDPQFRHLSGYHGGGSRFVGGGVGGIRAARYGRFR